MPHLSARLDPRPGAPRRADRAALGAGRHRRLRRRRRCRRARGRVRGRGRAPRRDARGRPPVRADRDHRLPGEPPAHRRLDDDRVDVREGPLRDVHREPDLLRLAHHGRVGRTTSGRGGRGCRSSSGSPASSRARSSMRVSARIGIGESLRYLRKHNDFVTRFLRPGGFSPDRLIKGLAARPRRPRGEGRRLPHLHVQRARRDRGVAAAEARRPVSRERYDVVIVGGGSAGCALANRLSADPSTQRARARGRAARLQVGRLHPHARRARRRRSGAASTTGSTSRSRSRSWTGAAIYHARGKVLGGSSSINGMIFQRGNPLDYERWAADPGMEGWDYAHCLPYFKRMESCLAGADDYRGGDGPLVLERGPADEPALPGVLRGRAAGGLSAHRRRQRLPAGGLRGLRPQHPPRPPPQRRAGLPAPGHAPPEPRGALPRVREPRSLRRHAGGRRRGRRARRARSGSRPAR